jgi:gamma-glutamyltranspeptidase
MLKEYGRLSLPQVLAPAIAMADGYAIEGLSAADPRAGRGAGAGLVAYG